MENFPAINTSSRFPVCIEIKPYLMDHRFFDIGILPAVEIMQVLAYSIRTHFPKAHIHTLKSAAFNRFLQLPPKEEPQRIDAFSEITVLENHDIQAVLFTRLKSKTGSITRSLAHATLLFSQTDGLKTHGPSENPFLPSDGPNPSCFQVSSDRIYRDLVPFGPAFQNIVGTLEVAKDRVTGNVRAGTNDWNDHSQTLLGSPFPLDAAFHAACVWGQRHARIIAFPMGFEQRVIVKATCPHSLYRIVVCPIKTVDGALFFDLWIYDETMEVCEIVKGLVMKDVAGGRMTPPSWVLDGPDHCISNKDRSFEATILSGG